VSPLAGASADCAAGGPGRRIPMVVNGAVDRGRT
jgi:hypothetical protein